MEINSATVSSIKLQALFKIVLFNYLKNYAVCLIFVKNKILFPVELQLTATLVYI